MPDQNENERADRYRELSRAREQVVYDLERDLNGDWQIVLGKNVIPVRLHSTGFSWIYVGLDIAAFAFGVACIFIGPTWRELGIALIVGAMFAIGTFVGQLLSAQLSIEQHQADLLWRDRLTEKYAARLAELDEEIQALRSDERPGQDGRRPSA